MIKSEGIAENAHPWHANVAAKIMKRVGMENVIFEAANPLVYECDIKNYGVNVNLFIARCQTVQLESLRGGI